MIEMAPETAKRCKEKREERGCIGREANAGNTRATSKFMILVEFSNLTFGPTDEIEWVSNSNSFH
jgi:hypothetical protein